MIRDTPSIIAGGQVQKSSPANAPLAKVVVFGIGGFRSPERVAELHRSFHYVYLCTDDSFL